MVDTSVKEYTAEDLITYKLQRSGIYVAKPKFDMDGTNLFALLRFKSDTGIVFKYCLLVRIVDNMKFEVVGAQQVAVRDLLVCLQNITLGKITKNQQEFSVYPMAKHPRILLDRKGNLKIVEYGQPDYPESEEIELSNIYKLKNS